MKFFILFVCAVFAVLPFASAFSRDDWAVTCTSSAWWAFFPVNASIIDPLVPPEFPFVPTSSLPPVLSSLPSGQRMLSLEFNKQKDCFTPGLPFIKTTFTEFKVQVPFLKATKFNNAAPLMYKPIIYANNLINAIGGTLQYGLNTVFAANMPYEYENNRYTVEYSDGFITGEFTPKSEWFPISNLTSGTLPAFYIPLHEEGEWLGHDVFQHTRCAKHYYFWSETKIRTVDASIKFDAGILNGNNAAFSTNIIGNTNPLATAFQIETVHRISPLERCSTVSGPFGIYWKVHPDRVLDISNGQNADGTPVITWEPNGQNNQVGFAQKFEWYNDELIRWVGTNKCLDVTSGDNSNGNKIIVWTCDPKNKNQKFQQKGDLIEWKGKGKCLDIDGGNTEKGIRLQIWECGKSNTNQHFVLQYL